MCENIEFDKLKKAWEKYQDGDKDKDEDGYDQDDRYSKLIEMGNIFIKLKK